MALSMIGASGVVAQNKSDTIKPNPPVEEIKQPAQSSEFEIPGKGQIFDRGKPNPSASREAAPPVEEIKQPAQSSEFEIPGKGQIFDRGKPNPSASRQAAPPPADDGGTPPSAEWEDPNGGQHFIRGRPGPPPGARQKGPKIRDKSASNTSRLLTIGGLAGLFAGIALAASGSDDNPTSP
jgi:hypothetical protein